MLFDILSCRKCVNLLKSLSESEELESISGLIHEAELLYQHNLIHIQDGDDVKAGISLKGRQFIKQLDELKDIVENKSTSRKLVIDYNLTKREMDLLLTISRSLYEYEIEKLWKVMKKPYKIKKSFMKDLNLLEELNLIKSFNKKVMISEVGKKVIKHELLKEYNLLM